MTSGCRVCLAPPGCDSLSGFPVLGDLAVLRTRQECRRMPLSWDLPDVFLRLRPGSWVWEEDHGGEVPFSSPQTLSCQSAWTLWRWPWSPGWGVSARLLHWDSPPFPFCPLWEEVTVQLTHMELGIRLHGGFFWPRRLVKICMSWNLSVFSCAVFGFLNLGYRLWGYKASCLCFALVPIVPHFPFNFLIHLEIILVYMVWSADSFFLYDHSFVLVPLTENSIFPLFTDSGSWFNHVLNDPMHVCIFGSISVHSMLLLKSVYLFTS